MHVSTAAFWPARVLPRHDHDPPPPPRDACWYNDRQPGEGAHVAYGYLNTGCCGRGATTWSSRSYGHPWLVLYPVRNIARRGGGGGWSSRSYGAAAALAVPGRESCRFSDRPTVDAGSSCKLNGGRIELAWLSARPVCRAVRPVRPRPPSCSVWKGAVTRYPVRRGAGKLSDVAYGAV